MFGHFNLSGDKDFFRIEPNAQTAIFSYTPSLQNLKFSTCASAFPREAWWPNSNPLQTAKLNATVTSNPAWFQLYLLFSFAQVLEASPALDRYWRVAYLKAEKD